MTKVELTFLTRCFDCAAGILCDAMVRSSPSFENVLRVWF
jgi:hypothetical protein